MTAVQVQMEFLDQARKYVDDRFGADADDQTKDVLSKWESVLVRLEDDPASCARELDWVAKLELLEGFRARDGLDWDVAPAAARRPAVLRRARPTRASTTGSWPAGGWSGCSPRSR